jgi:hypothetical protein
MIYTTGVLDKFRRVLVWNIIILDFIDDDVKKNMWNKSLGSLLDDGQLAEAYNLWRALNESRYR